MFVSDQVSEISGAPSVELAEDPFPSLASSRSEADKKSRKATSVEEQRAIILVQQAHQQQLIDKIRGLRDHITTLDPRATDTDRVFPDPTAILQYDKFKLKLQLREFDLLQKLRHLRHLDQSVTNPIPLSFNECESGLRKLMAFVRTQSQAEEHEEFIEYFRSKIHNKTATAVFGSDNFWTLRENCAPAKGRVFLTAGANLSATRSHGAAPVSHPKKPSGKGAVGDTSLKLPDKNKSKGKGGKSGGATGIVTCSTPAGEESE